MSTNCDEMGAGDQRMGSRHSWHRWNSANARRFSSLCSTKTMNVSLLGDQNSFWLICVFVHGLDQGNSCGADGVHSPNAC